MKDISEFKKSKPGDSLLHVSEVGFFPPEGAVGFVVVARHSRRGFITLSAAHEARALRLEEVWLFGSPMKRSEKELWEALAPVMASLPEGKVHERVF